MTKRPSLSANLRSLAPGSGRDAAALPNTGATIVTIGDRKPVRPAPAPPQHDVPSDTAVTAVFDAIATAAVLSGVAWTAMAVLPLRLVVLAWQEALSPWSGVGLRD